MTMQAGENFRVDEREKRYSERDIVEAKRQAFVRGAEFYHREFAGSMSVLKGVDKFARREYPLPRVTRPRVVTEPWIIGGVNYGVIEWKCIDGAFWHRYPNVHLAEWRRITATPQHGAPMPTPDRVRLWADLLANPTETVDADAVTERSEV